MTLDYDIIVIGGGHAGCEAASAAARLGSRTLLLTMDMAKLAAMSCNPAVGGVAKGQIVREIDALGGQMGRITDLTTIQFRMLNRSKGAAMWSPRAQCDKTRFSEEWRRTLENTWNLYIWQDAATEVRNSETLIPNGGTGFRFNNEGNQVSYRCDVKKVVTINFDRNKVRKMCADLSKKSDEISGQIDAAVVNTQVAYEAPFDVNDTFSDVFEAFAVKQATA